MILNNINAFKAPDNFEKYEIFYFYSTQEYLLKNIADVLIEKFMQKGDYEVTKLSGPSIDVEEVIAAAGTISFFGTKRIVHIANIELSSINDADLKALCDVMQSIESSVLIITALFDNDKALTTKKADLLKQTAGKTGLGAQIAKPDMQNAKYFVVECAKKNSTQISSAEAALLVQRIGIDYATLENEVLKLSASCNYKQITKDIIVDFSIRNIEADVFEMLRLLNSNNLPKTLNKLQNLLDLQNEPIAITAALASSFIDMYRIKNADKHKKSIAYAMKDFGYKGSDYRLKKAQQNARNYTQSQIESALLILCDLDVKLKSTPVNGAVLLQSAIFEIAMLSK